MLEGMMIALVIAAVAQLPWLIYGLFTDRRDHRGGGGKADDQPAPQPIEPRFDWEQFEDGFRAYSGERGGAAGV
jgi:hypothetical protein